MLLILMVSHNIYATPKTKKVLIVLNEGYRPEEYFEPRKTFDKAGFSVVIAGKYLGNILPSRPHIKEVPPIAADTTFDKVSVREFDAIVFVGGTGAWSDFLPNKNIHKILIEAIHLEKVVGLICAATGLLATSDNLDGSTPQFKGRHVTGYFEVEGILKLVGQTRFDSGKPGKAFVVSDGNLITGRDPISAKLFGERIRDTLLK